MLCPKCGNQLADGSRFCPYCGSGFGVPSEQSSSSSQEAFDQRRELAPVSPVFGAEPGPGSADPMHDPRGMKWFKFVIYFQLFATAAVDLFNALSLFTGVQYGENTARVYAVYPGMKTADYLFGLCCLALAVFAVYTRFRLAKFRANGPALYYALMALNLLASLIYLALAASATGQSIGYMVDSDILTSVLISLALLVVNMIYFGKRKDLFVN